MHLPERVKKLENVEYLGNYEKNLNVRSNVLIGMNILMFEWMLKNVEGVSRQKKRQAFFPAFTKQYNNNTGPFS